jgi:hypothetical protein
MAGEDLEVAVDGQNRHSTNFGDSAEQEVGVRSLNAAPTAEVMPERTSWRTGPMSTALASRTNS